MSLPSKSLLWLLVFFLLYALIPLFIPAETGFPQHATQENDIKAETYLYASPPLPQHVIVGSSLSNRLDLSQHPAYFNLAFSGYSVFEGLQIILAADSLPQTVWIETNVMMRPRRTDFTQAMISPAAFYSKKYIPVLRAAYQPVTVWGGLVKHAAIALNVIKEEDTKPFRQKKSQALLETLLQQHQKNYAVKPDTAVLNTSLRLLDQYVQQLQARGTKVIFFEMPIHTSLRNLALPSDTRAGIKKTFPPAVYKHIEAPDNLLFHTNDGIHLGSDEAILFRDYLLNGI